MASNECADKSNALDVGCDGKQVTCLVDRIKKLVSDMRLLLENKITHGREVKAGNQCPPDIVALFLMAEEVSRFNDDISAAVASYVKKTYKFAVRDILRAVEKLASSEKYLWTLYLERKILDDSSCADCEKRISDCFSELESSKDPCLSLLLWLFPNLATNDRLKTVRVVVEAPETAPWWQRGKMLFWLACMGVSACGLETVCRIEAQIRELQLETGAFATVKGKGENGDLISSAIGLLVLISCAKKNNGEGPIMDALQKTVRWIIERIPVTHDAIGSNFCWAYYALCEYVNLFRRT